MRFLIALLNCTGFVGLPEVQSPTRPSEEESVGHRIEADEVINPDEGLDAEELKKREQDIETQHNAQVCVFYVHL